MSRANPSGEGQQKRLVIRATMDKYLHEINDKKILEQKSKPLIL